MFPVAGCLVLAGCGGAPDPSAEDTCRRPPGTDGPLRSARRTPTSFTGDRYVGRLRWVAQHGFLETGGDVAKPRQGVVPVSGGTDPDPDYGAPTKYHMGGLRLQDGKVLWQRPGGPSYGRRADDDAAEVLTAPTRPGVRSAFGAFDARTGRARSCGLPALRRVLDDGTAMSAGTRTLARIRLRDGASLWRRPDTETFQHVVVGGGVVAASTDTADPSSGASASETVTEVSVLRLADGGPLWKITDRAAPGPDAVGLPERTILGIADDRVVLTDRHRLRGLRTADGKVLWSRPSPRWQDGASFTAVGGRLLIAAEGRVTAYRMADGAVDWTAPSRDLPDLSASAAYGGLLYAPVPPRPGLGVIDLRRGTIATTLAGVVGGSHERHVAAGDGALVVQDGDRTMAFDLRRG